MIIGSELIFIKNLPSTNLYAVKLLKTAEPREGTLIHTNFQSEGRGQQGNKWESEDGKNLLISVILFPSMIRPEDQFIISMSISLGICDFLKEYLPECSVKWPNDIYLKNDKIAGILIENSLIYDKIEFTVAGIGLNVNQVKFLSDAPNPVSMSVTGQQYDLRLCLSKLAACLDLRYNQLISGEHRQIREEYNKKLYRLNEWNSYQDSAGRFTGRILSVGNTGGLNIEKKSGQKIQYNFKEIEFIR